MQAKVPGELTTSRPVDLGFKYDQVFGAGRIEAYERLLADAIDGQAALFARQDGVEQEWRIVSPVLASSGPVHLYEPGSWGPVQADRLLAPGSGWHNPETR